MKYSVITLSLLILVSSCTQDESKSNDNTTHQVSQKSTSAIEGKTLLKEIEAENSGITFSNDISQNSIMNCLSYDGMLQGAGVGILDYNNDGLQDIYFASNMKADRLYENKGGFKFEDVTERSKIVNNKWSTGVAIVDINNDGYDDIYVCQFMLDNKADRANKFYINNGDGTFTDKARELRVADTGYSIMANFLDYDRDGDLDIFVANQPPNSTKLKQELKGKIDKLYTDRLYRNDKGIFIDVTKVSGVENYAYSLSATTLDFNEDGWPDIYVASDYDEADFYYRNNGDGTFSNVVDTAMKHISNFSMGADVADVNNDGHLDLFVADMVAEDNFRQKTNMSGMNPERFYALAKAGYHYQYMFNTLQLNNGDNSFSEIAQLSGISNTDWSWTPLFIDFDQDSYKDLIITNGIFKELRNKDFEIWRKKYYQQKLKTGGSQSTGIDPMEIIAQAKSVKLKNYVYKNNGDLTFSKKSDEWGLSKETWSQGAAYADFDNDGDLDLVISNMEDDAGLYQNMINEYNGNNYIAINLKGSANNLDAINTMIEITTNGNKQLYEYTPYRGYMSTSEKVAHFGLGNSTIVNDIKIVWSDNRMINLKNIKANQTLELDYNEADKIYDRVGLKKGNIFTSVNSIKVAHQENEYNDFIREVLLPYRTSTLGPVVAVGDCDGDGLEDLFIGSSFGQPSKILKNMGNGGFQKTDGFPTMVSYEDGGAAFFDADDDSDLDLYVTGGGNEFKAGHKYYADRLFLNDGKGTFTFSPTIPFLPTSNSVVLPLDYDNDGDLDLFVGGRQVPGKYGYKASSYLLQNNNGIFSDVTNIVAPFFKELGMVTDAKLADINNDKKKELLITGEWMPIMVISLGSTLTDHSEKYGMSDTNGWWNTISIHDIDSDGDLDIVAGNLGHNIKYKASKEEPFKVFVDDFDGNGTNDVYLGYYEKGKCYPVRGRQCSSEQMPFVSDKFKSYNDFGLATIDQVLEGKITEKTSLAEAQTFSNTIYLNENGNFKEIVLPNEAQISPVYGIAIDDFDKDGKVDIFLAGNMYQREVETTRSDAGKGCMLTYKSNGTFDIKRSATLGVSADKDVRDVVTVKSGDNNLLVIANNNAAFQFYTY